MATRIKPTDKPSAAKRVQEPVKKKRVKVVGKAKEAVINIPAMRPPVAAPTRWLELAGRFPLRPVRTEEEYQAGHAIMTELLDAERSIEEDDFLNVLSDLLADWEDVHHELDPATPGTMLRALIEERRVTQAEVAAATGIGEPNLSAMAADKRGIGKASRAKLAAYFGVRPDRFVVE